MQYIEPLLYIGISQSFFAGLLVATKKPVNTANRILSAWIFLICAELIFALVKSRILEMYSFPFIAFTYGPLMHLYVRYLTESSKKFNWFTLLHFIPFIAFFTISIIFRSEPLVRDLRHFFKPDEFISLRLVYGTCFFLSITVYSALAFNDIRKHQLHLRNIVSFTSDIITLNWLKVISIGFYLAFVVLFILGGLNIIGDYIPFDPYFVIFGFITVFSFAFSFYGIKQPVIFGSENIRDIDEKKETSRYTKSGLRDEDAAEYLRIIIETTVREKLFLKRDLSIHDLSERTGISRHHITQVLNEKHGKNFFTFINEYRVKEVIRMFGDPRYNHYTILAIAYDAGFNSKASFNSIFKTHTGLTPSEYRLKFSGIDN